LYELIADRIDEEPVLRALAEGVPRQSLAKNLAAFSRGRDHARARTEEKG
jgi:Pyruvate/2-oxoacid:ferredoxin oxidoreductase gamma subunit